MKRICVLLLALLMLTACVACTSEVSPPSPAVEDTLPPAPEEKGLFDPTKEIRAEVYDSRLERVYLLASASEITDSDFIAGAAEMFSTLGTEAYDGEELALRQEWAANGGTVELRLVQGDIELTYILDSLGVYLKLNGLACRITENAAPAEELLRSAIRFLPDADESEGNFRRDNEMADYVLSNGLQLHMSYGEVVGTLGSPDSTELTVSGNGDGTARAEYVLSYGEELRLQMYYTGNKTEDFESSLAKARLGKVELFGAGVSTAGGAVVGMGLDEFLSCCGFAYACTDFTSIDNAGEYDAWCLLKKDIVTEDVYPAELLFFITDAAVSGIVLQDYSLCGGSAPLTDSARRESRRLLGDGADNGLLMVVTDTGELYGRGNNHYLELFFGEDGDYDWIHLMSGVEQLYEGFLCCYALTSDGGLYGWGASDGEAFLEAPSLGWTYRHHIMDGVTDFATNGHEFYVLRSDGSLWGWGAGHDAVEHIMDDVSSVRFCRTRFFAIDRDGNVYSWQGNGLDETEWSAADPQFLLSGIRDVSGLRIRDAQENYIWYYEFLTDGGELFLCGPDRMESGGPLTKSALQAVAADVRDICGNGYIKNDGSFWYWTCGDAGLKALRFAENVLAAGTTVGSAIVIDEKNELLVFDTEGTIVRHWSMEIFS